MGWKLIGAGILTSFLLKKRTSKRQQLKKTKGNGKSKREDYVIKSKVAGVTFKNPDGRSRQRILKKCRRGDTLLLRPQPIKGHPYAVAICRRNGQQIGHIRSHLSKQVFGYLAAGLKVECKILQLTGGTRKKPIRGCNIAITVKR
ncbi:MAG: hypothetical protein GX335_04610 [Firmicutes bacterium]|nr:hypothetical protein [Bacillota bacterium]